MRQLHEPWYSKATHVYKKSDLEVARIFLGHAEAHVAQICPEQDACRAATVAARIG
ncbi:MAG: hypothetical protein WBF17_08055 [Phycisphaerae bacterium]